MTESRVIWDQSNSTEDKRDGGREWRNIYRKGGEKVRKMAGVKQLAANEWSEEMV